MRTLKQDWLREYNQQHVIRAITSALQGPKSGKGPIRSFLFVNGSQCGSEELIIALAEQLFNDEDRVIEFDMKKNNTEDDHVVFREFRENLIDSVNKMPSAVILIRNIDKAHASAIDFLLEILINGKIADEKAGKWLILPKC